MLYLLALTYIGGWGESRHVGSQTGEGPSADYGTPPIALQPPPALSIPLIMMNLFLHVTARTQALRVMGHQGWVRVAADQAPPR